MGQSGEGVGRFENFTVFIPYALPGETVEAKITLVKKKLCYRRNSIYS